MRNKRTRWIHCYLQYFVHFQCSLHGPEDAQIFIANLRKKIIKFSKHAFREGFVHFLSKNCSNCFFVFDLSNCQGGVGGGMITFLELAHMFDATQIGGFGMLTFFELAHMCDATQIGGFGMLTFFELAHMFDATQIGGFGMLTFFELAHMFDATQIPCVRKGLGK